MNLFLKKNFFIETNRSASTSNLQTFQLNKMNNKIYSPRLSNTFLLNRKIFSPKISLKHNQQILKMKPNSKNNKNIFSARTLPTKYRTWKINSKIILPKKNFLTQKDETKVKDERIESLLSEVINWDNKQLIENNVQFKDAKTYCEKEKQILNMQRVLSDNNLNYLKIRNKTNRNEDKKLISKFSVFKENFIPKFGKLNYNTKDNKL